MIKLYENKNKGYIILKEKYISCSIYETQKIAQSIIEKSTNPKNLFIALYGDLGAGKTAFVKGIINHFCEDVIVTSPTYNIVNKYSFENTDIYHFDMYRITDEEDLYSVGFYDYLDEGIIVTEWSENIPYAIPKNAVKVTINKLFDETKREIIVEYPDDSIST